MNTKLKFVLMILPWLFLFLISMEIGFSVNPTPKFPSYLISRKLFSSSQSAGEQKTSITLSISEVLDPIGNAVMLNQPWVIICPGDTITMALAMTRNGHIASFALTDPVSGKLLSITYPSTEGSEVKDYAALTFTVPQDASLSNKVSVPWQAEMFIVVETQAPGANKPNTEWFRIIKPVSGANTETFPITTPENRNAWSQERTREIFPMLFKLCLLVSVITALLWLVRRSILAVVSTLIIFAGLGISFIPIMDGLFSDADSYFCILVAVSVVGYTAIKILSKFHSNEAKELFEQSGKNLTLPYKISPTSKPVSPPFVHHCPKCGIPMMTIMETEGENQGKRFYMCPNYSKCRQLIPAE